MKHRLAARVVAAAKVAAMLSIAFAGVSAGRLFMQLQSTVGKLDGMIDDSRLLVADTRRYAGYANGNVNAILLQAGLAADEIRRAAGEQRSYWNRAGSRTVDALQRVNLLITQVQETTGHMDASQRQVAAASVAALQSLVPASQASADAMRNAARGLEDLDRILADRNIPSTMQHVNDAASHLESTTASIDEAVKRMTKPRSLLRSLLLGGLDVGAKTAVIVK